MNCMYGRTGSLLKLSLNHSLLVAHECSQSLTFDAVLSVQSTLRHKLAPREVWRGGSAFKRSVPCLGIPGIGDRGHPDPGSVVLISLDVRSSAPIQSVFHNWAQPSRALEIPALVLSPSVFEACHCRCESSSSPWNTSNSLDRGSSCLCSRPPERYRSHQQRRSPC